MKNENILAIIPARGGSKRIPGKNIREFLGKPIIAYSIEAALKADIFDEVMVSTDSREIADIALECGAKVPFMRDKVLSDDFATTDDVIVDTIKRYENRQKNYKWVACIYPTAPFVTSEQLKDAYKKIVSTPGAVATMTMTAFSYPPQRSHIIGEDGFAVFKEPEYISARSQDLVKMYHDAGQFYIYDAQYFVRANGIITEKIIPVIVDEMRVQDIDNESDWKLAELKYSILNNIV